MFWHFKYFMFIKIYFNFTLLNEINVMTTLWTYNYGKFWGKSQLVHLVFHWSTHLDPQVYPIEFT